MNKRLCCLLCTAALLLCACARLPDEGAPDARESGFPTPEETLARLCAPEYAGRAAGSEGNAAAAEYLAARLAELGLEPLGEDFYFRYEQLCHFPERAAAKLALLSPDGTRTELTPGVDCLHSLANEALDGTFPLSADKADCADGAAVLFAGSAAEVSSFCEGGARRLAVYCAEDFSTEKGLVNSPRKADAGFQLALGESLRPLLEEPGARLALSVGQSMELGEAKCVAAVLRGSEGKNALIFSAHFDGTGFCGERLYPSAYDNASGTAAVLEAARLAAERGLTPKNDLIFVFFNGEETGLTGSRAFAPDVAARYEQISVVNVDCVGDAENTGVLSVGDAGGRSAALQRAVMEELGPETTTVTIATSDDLSFSTCDNASAVWIEDDRADGARFHTSGDTPDRLDPARIAAVGAALCALAEGDVVYPPDAPALSEQTAEPSEEEALRARLLADGTLARFTDAYIMGPAYTGAFGAFKALTGAEKTFFSAAELHDAFPACSAPDELDGCAFLYAQATAMLDGQPYSRVFFPLNGDFAAGQVCDLTDRLTPTYLRLCYRAEDGRALSVLLAFPAAGSEDDGKEDGAALSPALSGWRLEHTVLPEHGIDGYYQAQWSDGRGARVAVAACTLEASPLPASPWEQPGEGSEKPRFLAAEELTALLGGYDFTAMTGRIAPLP